MKKLFLVLALGALLAGCISKTIWVKSDSDPRQSFEDSSRCRSEATDYAVMKEQEAASDKYLDSTTSIREKGKIHFANYWYAFNECMVLLGYHAEKINIWFPTSDDVQRP